MFFIKPKISSGKKGIMALEALIGTIMSVIGLILLFMVFDNFLESPNNYEDIVESNAKSIVEFVNYFGYESSSYSNQENCFNMMRINYLENFQFTTDNLKENYFYIITKSGVHIISYNYLEDFKNQVEMGDITEQYLNRINKNFFEFEENINLLFDDTDKNNLNFLTNVFFLTDELSLELKKTSDDNSYYHLDPSLVETSNKILSYINFEDKATNRYDVNFFERNKVKSGRSSYIEKINELENPNYLVFANKYNGVSNGLFVTNSEYSLAQIRNNICSKKLLSNRNVDEYYRNIAEDILSNPEKIRELDYQNLIIIFEEIINNNNQKISFEWNQKPVCKINNNLNNCQDILKENSFNFEIFLENIIKYYKNSKSNELRVKEIRSLSLEDMKNSEYSFNEIFNEHIDGIEISEYRTSLQKQENNIFDLPGFETNGCSEEQCDDTIFRNSKIYFYVSGDYDLNKITYYSFNQQLLRKKTFFENNKRQTQIFFKGIPVQIENDEVEQYGVQIIFFDKDLDRSIYKFNIDLDTLKGKKEYEIFLSEEQYYGIPELEENKIYFGGES